MTDFEFIRGYLEKRTDKFVHYRIINREELLSDFYFLEFVRDKIITDTTEDFFAINFPQSNDKSETVCIDSMDSFSFDLYLVFTHGKIIITDAGRTYACGVEEYEGNGVIREHFDVVEKYLAKNNIAFENHIYYKETDKESFISDIITFAKVMQTLNNAQRYPPYVLELDAARDLVAVLTRAWVNDESINDTIDACPLAVFGNNKVLVNAASCYKSSPLQYENRNAVVAVIFNSEDEVLVSRNSNGDYSFAINDFVLKDETDTLESLQRLMEDRLGVGFYFGEIAPAISVNQNRTITDYYLISGYDVSLSEMIIESDNSVSWLAIDDVFDLIRVGKFTGISISLMNLICEMKEQR